MIVYPQTWKQAKDQEKYCPIDDINGYLNNPDRSKTLNFVMIDCYNDGTIPPAAQLQELAADKTVVLCLSSTNDHAMPSVRRMFVELQEQKYKILWYSL